MSLPSTDFAGSVVDAVRSAIEERLPEARANVAGASGHFRIEVVSPVFAGKSLLECQRLVYGAIGHLMKGENAPVHAIDSLQTRTPETA